MTIESVFPRNPNHEFPNQKPNFLRNNKLFWISDYESSPHNVPCGKARLRSNALSCYKTKRLAIFYYCLQFFLWISMVHFLSSWIWSENGKELSNLASTSQYCLTLREAVSKSFAVLRKGEIQFFWDHHYCFCTVKFSVSITPPYAKKFVNLFISFPAVHTVC